jgi:hypothetical protein
MHYRASTTRGEFCQLLFVPVHGELIGCSFYVQKTPNISTYSHAPYTYPTIDPLMDPLMAEVGNSEQHFNHKNQIIHG